MTNPNTATLADVRDQLSANTSLPERKRRDLISAVHRITTYLHRPAEDITTAPHRLRQLLAGIHPVQAPTSPNRQAADRRGHHCRCAARQGLFRVGDQ